ncbi:MAG TPA: cobalamin biosynthesis protein [Polyangiaceae bacterium]|nr:cobalamin biosynthesis protein [Polyangiaceae bacterium]
MIERRRPFAVYAITRHGIAVASRLAAALPETDLFVSEKLAALAPPRAKLFPLPMGPLLAGTFRAYDAHVFVISVGAVVRMIAPLLVNKKVDPAVVCVDDTARFSICVLSGHVGRGNVFSERVAEVLGATPVVTTASDALGTLTVDILGRDLGWTLDDPDRNVTRASAAVVNEAPVLVVQESGEPGFWPPDRKLPPGVHYTTSLEGVDPDAWEMLLIASTRDVEKSHPRHFARSVVYRPKSLVLGVGCDRGTPFELVARGVASILAAHGLSDKSVRSLATIDKKADEPALNALSAARGWPLVTFSAEVLDAVRGIETPSERVKGFVGTRGVSEPAALLAAGSTRLLVPKQRYTEEGAGRSMTLAIAELPFSPHFCSPTLAR